ncbi:DUF898 family protein [Rhodobacteraceae bacterium CCMM004]|nr:DUF898 family protein [Rhodobacteraceae bacterium CCMM004]
MTHPPIAHDRLATEFVGRRGPLFWLALRSAVLTLLTLGLYRFWMKTRLRRYYWSSVRPGGLPLEYVGEPMEKLLGFLIAVVILAFYIGIVNLALMFGSFAILHGNMAAYVLSFVGVIPIVFYARYRARRYVLARTRWRGIRFGVEPGAWGYAWRALLHWATTLLTLGLLWPRMTFWLEKYRTDRTRYGILRLHQGGRWTMLVPAYAHVLIGAVFSLLVLILPTLEGLPPLWPMLFVFVPWLLYGIVHYQVTATRILADYKTAGGLRLSARPRPWRVVRIYALGTALTVLGLVALLIVVAAVMVALFTAFGVTNIGRLLETQDPPLWLTTAGAVAAYFAFFIALGVFRHVFLTLPLWRHYAETLAVAGTGQLSRVRQVPRDRHTEAEGFAEALDLGAAI